MIDKLRLDELCTPKSSNLAQKDIQENDGDYPVYGASGFIKNINFYHQESEYIAVVKDGAGIGRAMFLPAKSSIIGTMQYLIPKNNVDPKYLYYAVKGMNLSKYYSGATIPHIYFKDYKKESVPLYSKDQQKMISRSLEKVEELIIKKQQLLNEYDQLIKSRFVEMFGQDLKGKSIRLGDLAEVITKGTTPTTLGYDFVDDGVNFIKVECITETGKFIKEKMLHINEECNEKLKRSKLKKDDILFSIAGAIGRTAIVTDDILPANTNQALSIIRLRKDVGLNVEFLNQVFKTDLVAEQIEKRINGVAQMNVSLADIGNLKIIRPTIERQNEFASFVKQVDKLKFENEILYSIYRFTINKQTKLLSYRGVTL